MNTDFGKTNIQYLKGVGEKRAKLFQKLGISSIAELLDFYPRAYEDWSNPLKIKNAPLNEVCCIRAKAICEPSCNKVRENFSVFRFIASDGENIIPIVIFNNKYAADKIKTGIEYLFFGKVTGDIFQKEMLSPQIEPAENGNRIRPVYRQSEGLSTRITEKCVSAALQRVGDIKFETLSPQIREKYKLCDIYTAYANIHNPQNKTALSEARKRLAFDELLKLQLGTALLRQRDKKENGAIIKKIYTEEFASFLPFKMTDAQLKSINDCVYDMSGNGSMRRLIQGDVGSGKTCVALSLAYTVIKNGFQCVMMAPTEILARQHFETASRILANKGIRIAILLGSTGAKSKKEIKNSLKSGEIDLIIGTHALIQSDVEFSSLGLVIADEQHRFGVAQRSALIAKGKSPHVLVMSATPIPRTLALIIYGELDVSIIDEMPPGRKPISTYLINSEKRERAYNFLKKHIDDGRQGYIVCPMVEEGEAELKAAENYSAELQNGIFKGYAVGLLHGKLKSNEKLLVSEAFSSGKTDILVATTVIEVGIDVPNATIMIIENAEHFGMSQLHQLRGRIGRGEFASSCILISDTENKTALGRLKTMCKTDNGFKIADEDLKQRGPGDFFGSRQHGLPEFKIANLFSDMYILKQTREVAETILSQGFENENNRRILEAVKEMFASVGEDSLN